MSTPREDLLHPAPSTRPPTSPSAGPSAATTASAERGLTDPDHQAKQSESDQPAGAWFPWLKARAERVYRWLLANSFAPAWLPPGAQRPSVGYVVAAVVQLLAVIATIWLDNAFPDFMFPGLLFVLVIVLVALTFGAGPSLLATLAGALLIDYFLISPSRSMRLPHPADAIGMALLLLVGITISVVASRIERQRRAAQELAIEREAMLEAVPDAFFVYDESGRVVQVNSATHEMLGTGDAHEYTVAGTTKRVTSLAMRDVHGGPIPREQWPIIRVLRGETLKGATSQDVLITTFNGHDVFLNISGSPVRDRDGRLVGAALVMRDVTTHRQLEDAVRASARRTHEALNALLAMAEVLVATEPGESVQAPPQDEEYTVSPVARRLAELTCSVLACRRVAITAVDPQTDVVRPIAVAGLSAEQERQWWAEQPQGARLSDSPDQALVARLRSGESVVVDMTQPPYDELPNPYHVHDLLIAPMRMGEQMIGMLTLDHGGVPHTYTPDEIALAAAVAKLVGLVVEREQLLRDREEARASELSLAETNHRMNDFLGVASHELKTPVTSLKVNVQLAARWLAKLSRTAAGLDPQLASEVEPIRDLLARSDRTMARLTRLVDDLLDVSRIRAGKLELRREPCDLLTIVRDAVQEQRAVAAESSAGREIRLRVPDLPAIPVDADADRIGQVLTNYLTNALKYSAETAPVEVRVEIEPNVVPAEAGGSDFTPLPVGEGSGVGWTGGRAARVSVRDEGPGLPATELARVWEPFHRAEGVTVQSGSGVGLGLGLFISQTIVERHGGAVGVESTRGEGSTFWFTLPLAT